MFLLNSIVLKNVILTISSTSMSITVGLQVYTDKANTLDKIR